MSAPVSLTSIISSTLINISEYTLTESFVINNTYFIILLVSNDVINTLEFLEEDWDNFINNFNVISESFNFGHVEISMGLEFSFSGVNGINGLLISLESSSFMSLSHN